MFDQKELGKFMIPVASFRVLYIPGGFLSAFLNNQQYHWFYHGNLRLSPPLK